MLRARIHLLALLAPAAFLHAGPAHAELPDCTIVASDISAEPESITLGSNANIYWSFDGPNECPVRINGEDVEQYGSRVVQPQTATTYRLTTETTEGAEHELDRVTITVTPDCAIETTGTFSTLPRTIHIGQRAELLWSVQRPAACNLPLRINERIVASEGLLVVQPAATTVYNLTTDIPDGERLIATVTVAVSHKTVRIRGNTQRWKDLLINSLAEHGTRIILAPNVDMDLSGYQAILIGESVTLIGGRNARNPGPRIYTRTRPRPLFLIDCHVDFFASGDNARLSGFRLHGPHFKSMEGKDNLEQGIQAKSCLKVEIDNMEVAGWSGQAIYIAEWSNNQRIFNPDAVRIHDNYIHHNQHVGGDGYGVDTSRGAYARIERNVFDFNRHAISSSGSPGAGYHAEDNLVLKGGGVHGKWYNTFTHQFDIHGDRTCGIGHLNCGNAGDQYWFYDNAFQYRRDYALKIRGTPRVAAYISGNVFPHDDLDDAVALRSRTRVHFGTGPRRNITDFDSYGQYGVCDFDADGKDDLFLATGKTWWYMSAARMHWVFLKKATERLNQVGLGYFDSNRFCDVLAAASGDKWEISPGGSGAWTPLPGTYPVPFNQLRFADFNGDGRTDIFRRAPDGQWSIVSPGVHGWRKVQSSSFPLSELRFGDFTGDGRADVLSRAGGRWSISRRAAGSWTRLNPHLNTDLKSVLIADVDGDGIDDVVRFKLRAVNSGDWQVSWGGRTDWKTLKTVTYPPPPPPPAKPLVGQRVLAGRFDALGGADLLHIDFRRIGRLYSHPNKTLARHNLFEY